MSGAAFWESLVKAGRAIYFPNIPLRLVAPRADAAEKGLNVVTFITVPQTTKVRRDASSASPGASRVCAPSLTSTSAVVLGLPSLCHLPSPSEGGSSRVSSHVSSRLARHSADGRR